MWTQVRLQVFGASLEGLLLGILLWLAVGAAMQAVLGSGISGQRALALGHWKLGFIFLGLVVISYPLHLFFHYPSHRNTTRRLLQQFIRLVAVCAAVVFMVDLNAAARVVVPIFSLSYAAYRFRRNSYIFLPTDAPMLLALLLSIVISFTPMHDTRATLCFWLLVPLYFAVNLGADGYSPKRLVAWFLLYSAMGGGMLAATVYGGNSHNDGKQHILLHALTGYAFAAAAFGHTWLSYKRLPSASRRALSISLVAAFAVTMGIDVARFMRLRSFEHLQEALAISDEPRQVSKFSALQGYATPSGANPDWFVPLTANCANYDCHPSITEQHNLSAHAHSMDNGAFKVELAHFIDDRGRLAADHCLGCHAPLGVIAFPAAGDGAIDPLTTKEPSFELGVGCIVCHRARPNAPADPKNASITIRPVWLEDFWPLLQSQTMEDFVASNLDKHVQMFRVRDWEPICGSCHVVSLPAPLAADKTERATIDQYTSFVSSPYGRASKTCSSCHQQVFVNADGYAVHAHSYLGSGASLPYDDAGPDKRLRDISIGFLSGLGSIELDIRPDGLPLCLDNLNAGEVAPSDTQTPLYNDHGVDLNRYGQRTRGPDNPFNGTNGGVSRRDLLSVEASLVGLDRENARLSIKTTNACIGHSFPSGEGIKGYLEVSAYDRTGRVVGHYGGLGEDGLPLALPTTLGVNAIDAAGNVIKDRRYWNAVEVVYRRVLDPGQPSEDLVDVPIESGAHPTKFDVRWNYLRPEYLRSRERGLKIDLPPVSVGSAVVE